MSKKKKRTKEIYKNETEIWTEEQYEQYMKGLYGLDFIAGYTESGVPFGLPLEEDNEEVRLLFDTKGEELPFD